MSNFRKRNVQQPLPGTRTSAQTGQVITSSGNPSLDLILGGGLPIGSICLIEEDKFVTHSKVLAKYFLAEGVLWQQSIFLGSLDDNPNELLKKLPRPLDEQEIEKENNEQAGAGGDGLTKNGLRIAWRYENLPLVNSEQTTAKIGHHFNLMEYLHPQYLDYTETVTWSQSKLSLNCNNETQNMEQQNDTSSEDVNNFDIKEENNENLNVTQESSDDSNCDNNLNIMQSNKTEEVTMSFDWKLQPKKDEDDNTTATTATATPSLSSSSSISALNIEIDVPKSEETTSSEESTTTTGDAGTTAVIAAAAAIEKLSADKPKIFHNNKFEQLWTQVHALLRERKFNEAALLHKSLCRVCLTSLGSPLWYDDEFSHDLLKFMTILRAAVRSQTSVCFITMPMNLIAKHDPSLVAKIRNLVDYAIELDSFAGTPRENHSAFKEYNGLLHIHKMTAINTLTAYMPETCDLAFKLRRKKFVIEKLHLPPELQEPTDSDEYKASAGIVPSFSCSATTTTIANTKASLDF